MIGTVTYEQSARFVVARGYIRSFGLRMLGASNPTISGGLYNVDWTDGVFHAPMHFELAANFVPPTTKAFTLDHMLVQAYGETDPPGGFYPLDVQLGTYMDLDEAGVGLRLTVVGFPTTAIVKWFWPPMPSGYWFGG